MGADGVGLLEREGELAELDTAVTRLARGEGGFVLVEGLAGSGKTTLLQALRRSADERGVTTLGAVAGELERSFPFGVVRQLLEPPLAALPADERQARFTGAAAAAQPIVGGVPAPDDASPDATFTALHGLYWLVAGLAETGPLALVVDDAHWADDASLRCLEFVARRAAETRVLVVVALRTDEPGAPHALLDALRGVPGPHLRPRPLTRAATAELLTGASSPVVDAAVAATGGNPLLLRELARTLEPLETTTADAVAAAVPQTVTRQVRARLDRLSPGTRAVAGALAVLGNARPIGLLADVLAIPHGTAATALAELEAAGLVEGTPPRYRHPLLRTAVADGVARAERNHLHQHAAQQLVAAGDDEAAAVHLLAGDPLHEAWAGELLRRAARAAAAGGAPEAALARLRRAAEELGPAAGLELELGTAALAAGEQTARRHLLRALEDTRPAIRAQAAATLLATGLAGADADDDVGKQLEAALPELDRDDADLHDRLAAALVTVRSSDPSRGDRRAATLAALPEGGPHVLAHRVFEAAAGDVSAADVAALAQRALGDGPMRDVAELERPDAMWAVVGLTSVDLTAADRALAEAETALRARPSRAAASFVTMIRGEWHLVMGDALRAQDHAQEAIELLEAAGNHVNALAARGNLGAALTLRGDLAGAEAALASAPPDTHFDTFWGGPNQWLARAQLRLAQQRPADAVTELRKVVAQCGRYGWHRYPYGTGAALLAQALIAAGETEEGATLARTEAAEQRRRGARRLEAEALVALAAAEPDVPPRDAVVAADEAGSPLLRARARLALGRTLRRMGARTEARAVLAAARELAGRCAAGPLREEAEAELLVAGGRPRRVATSGVDSLTPAERRTAEQAALGRSNREIAEALFVTRKTVETTLGRVYAKLGIRSRAQLPAALDQT